MPLLLQLFLFPPLQAVILNKPMSLVVVASALPFRAAEVPWAEVAAPRPIVLNLLAGTLVGAWLAAGWATRLSTAGLHRVIALLLIAIAAVLLVGHGVEGSIPPFAGTALLLAGVVAGLVIGAVASLLGVAGGELLIPTLILLFGVDVKLAGSLSLVVGLPTMLVGFARYSRDRSLVILREQARFALVMAAGSIAGSFLGARLLGVMAPALLLLTLALILLVSVARLLRHR